MEAKYEQRIIDKLKPDDFEAEILYSIFKKSGALDEVISICKEQIATFIIKDADSDYQKGNNIGLMYAEERLEQLKSNFTTESGEKTNNNE